MNHIIVFTIVIAALVVALSVLKKFRHEFCVSEGSTGLVYRHGLFVRRNNAGRHVLWGRGWTINLIDLRKMSWLWRVRTSSPQTASA